MNPVAFLLRATIFVPRVIGYSTGNKEKVQNLLANAQVAHVGNMITIGSNSNFQTPVIPDGAPWQLFSTDFSIQFLPNKIDLVQGVLIFEDKAEMEFIERSVEVFRSIMNIFEISSATRIAYAPIYAIEESDNFHVGNYMGKLINKPRFKEQPVQEVQINVNYIINLPIIGGEYCVNFIAKLSEGIKEMNDGVTRLKCVIIDLDLNTVGEDNQFTIDDVQKFFNSIQKYKTEYMNYLLSN